MHACGQKFPNVSRSEKNDHEQKATYNIKNHYFVFHLKNVISPARKVAHFEIIKVGL